MSQFYDPRDQYSRGGGGAYYANYIGQPPSAGGAAPEGGYSTGGAGPAGVGGTGGFGFVNIGQYLGANPRGEYAKTDSETPGMSNWDAAYNQGYGLTTPTVIAGPDPRDRQPHNWSGGSWFQNIGRTIGNH